MRRRRPKRGEMLKDLVVACPTQHMLKIYSQHIQGEGEVWQKFTHGVWLGLSLFFSGKDLQPISGLDFHPSYFSNIACLVPSLHEHMLHLRTVQTLTLILFLYCSQWIRCLHEQLSLWQWHEFCRVSVWGLWWADPQSCIKPSITTSPISQHVIHNNSALTWYNLYDFNDVWHMIGSSTRLWFAHAQCISFGAERRRGEGSS